jgi:hypothetical protein
LVILDTETVWDAIRLQPDRLFVLKGGRVVAESVSHRRVLRDGELSPLRLSSLLPLRRTGEGNS